MRQLLPIRTLAFAISAICASHWAAAQSVISPAANGSPLAAAPAAGPRKVTIYLTADGLQLPTEEGADHRAEITMRDSVSGMMRELYASGKLRRIIPFAHVERGIKHGVEMSFSEAGTVQTRQEFVAGRAEGALLVYYPTGVIKSRTNFQHDELLTKECFTAAGATRNCPAEDTPPTYPGGEPALIGEFMQKVKPPTGLLKRTVDGKVQTLHLAVVRLQFEVDSLGGVTQTRVMYSPTASWSEAVLKIVPKLRPFVPAHRDGRAVADAMEVALSFSLDEQYSPAMQSMYQPNLGQAKGTREINFRPQQYRTSGAIRR